MLQRCYNEKMRKMITVKVLWDDEANVWCADSDDLPGLNTWAYNREELHRKVAVMISELLEEEGGDEGLVPYGLQDVARVAACL